MFYELIKNEDSNLKQLDIKGKFDMHFGFQI